jgi:hypothetical protein
LLAFRIICRAILPGSDRTAGAPDFVEHTAEIAAKIPFDVLFRPAAFDQHLRDLRQIAVFIAIGEIARWDIFAENPVETVDTLPTVASR